MSLTILQCRDDAGLLAALNERVFAAMLAKKNARVIVLVPGDTLSFRETQCRYWLCDRIFRASTEHLWVRMGSDDMRKLWIWGHDVGSVRGAFADALFVVYATQLPQSLFYQLVLPVMGAKDYVDVTVLDVKPMPFWNNIEWMAQQPEEVKAKAVGG